MMKDNKTGPFKKGITKKTNHLPINSFLVGTALIVIAASQIPIAIKSTLDILNNTNIKQSESTKILSGN